MELGSESKLNEDGRTVRTDEKEEENYPQLGDEDADSFARGDR